MTEELLWSRDRLDAALSALSERDADIRRALAEVGPPAPRGDGRADFATLLRIIVGQQLSVKAAATIFGRVEATLGGRLEPRRLLALDDAELRAAGLSGQKVRYARGLAEAVLSGALDPPALAALDDEDVVEAVTALKGFGRWSAQMFLMFALGRPDVWPAGDLGVQVALQRLKRLEARPTPAESEALAAPWTPWRSAAALFLWHYHGSAPDAT
ncbi:MAG: DNA-3-methyladenine glycosylase 2 family protein [Wenzhouxiangellaceae bacterium]|nr:DNA-3-methyladenine glycosylase 2 family protein [Wenzhouxiangellaceae bacterium]